MGLFKNVMIKNMMVIAEQNVNNHDYETPIFTKKGL